MPRLHTLTDYALSRPLIAAVGDVHGCYRAAERAVAILEDIGRPVVFLGDYVDRGPSSVRTVDLLVQAKARNPDWVFLLGNHEALLLDAFRTGLRGLGNPGPVAADEEYDRLGGIPDSHRRFFESLHPFHETESLLFVHGGIGRDPHLPVGEHALHELIWTYEITPHWIGKKIIRGHDMVAFPSERENHVNLDTGACFEGMLTIGLLDDAFAANPAGRALLGVIQITPDGEEVREEYFVDEPLSARAA